MGGNAFAQPKPGQPALKVPRLSQKTYDSLRAHYTTLLRTFYTSVACPASSPNKLSHGDIDLLVQDPTHDFTPEHLSQHLGATRRVTNGSTTNFAIPLVEDPSNPEANEYLQLDIHVCQPGLLPWTLLLNSYGDLWQIVGVLLRPTGLTATDQGLHLRIPEIEPQSKKASMLFLTRDRSRTLAFLGLDERVYEAGFGTEEEVFGWVARGRFFEPGVRDRGTANDRQRLAKREMFARFVGEWAPLHAGVWSQGQRFSREEVCERAACFFGKEEEYGRMRGEWRLRARDEELWAGVKDRLRGCGLDGEALGLAVRALKRWVEFGDDGGLRVREEADMRPYGGELWVARLGPELDLERLLEWVEGNWEAVKKKEKARMKDGKNERAAERLRGG